MNPPWNLLSGAPAPLASASAAGLLLLLGASLVACSSTRPDEFENLPQREASAGHIGAYGAASTPDDLKRLLSEDLEAGMPGRALSGLEAFAGDNVQAETVTRGRLIWEAVKPVTMLQFNGGRAQMTGAKALEKMLVGKAEAEMKSAFNSLRTGDFDRVKRLRDNPMGIFHPSTAALSAEIRPYAALADGVLQYRELATASDPSEAQLQSVLAKLQEAQSALATIGDGEAAFLADSAAAQSLERAGQIDAAAEYWMRIADSNQFASQPPLMRNLVAARVKAYRVRLRESVILEVEDERRAELRSQGDRYETKVDALEAKHEGFADWARSGLGAAQAQLVSLRQGDEAQSAAIARMSEQSAARDAALAKVAQAVKGVDGRIDTANTDAEVRQRAIMGDLAEYRASVAELSAAPALDALAEGTDTVAEATSEASEGEAAETPKLQLPARLSLDAFPDIFGAIANAQAGVSETVRGAAGRVSEFIQPES